MKKLLKHNNGLTKLGILAVMILGTGCKEATSNHASCIPLVKYTKAEQIEALQVMERDSKAIESRMIDDYGKLRAMVRAACGKNKPAKLLVQ